jgi:hypothetical protein
VSGAQSASPPAIYCAHSTVILRSIHMLDIILVAAAVAFFALSVGYTIACDWL